MGDGGYGNELSQGKVNPSPPPLFTELNRGSKLVTMDEKKTVIAKFHRAHHFTKKQKARLEVQPEGMAMLDHIVLSFVYVEHKRREREKSAAAAAAS